MKEDRIYFLLNDANEIVEGFINATDAWRALYQADGTRSLIAKPLPMRLDDMSELIAKLDPDFQLPPGQFVGSTFHPTATENDLAQTSWKLQQEPETESSQGTHPMDATVERTS